MKLSKAYKAEHYDSVAADRSKLSLALYDLSNNKFSGAVILDEADYITGARRGVRKLAMSVSLRSMPIFLVKWIYSEIRTPHVFTESELEDISRDAYPTYRAMLRDAFYRCKQEFYPKVA